MTPSILALLFALSVTGMVLLAALAFARPRAEVEVRSRLRRARARGPGPKPRAPSRQRPTWQSLELALSRVLVPMAWRSTEGEAAFQLLLESAGQYDRSPRILAAQRLLYAGLLPLVALLVDLAALDLSASVMAVVVLLATWAGYQLPVSRLRNQVQRRHRLILRALPAILDLLTACVEAGLGLQAALAKVVEVAPPSELQDELGRTLREIQLGRPRTEAILELGRRVGLRELTSVTLALAQAEQAGGSIGRTLRNQSADIREARWQRAQEAAYQAPLKLVFPVAFLIFPVIFVVIFGPLLLGLMAGS